MYMESRYFDARAIEWELRTEKPFYMGDAIDAIPAALQACLEADLLSSIRKALEKVKPRRIYGVATGTSYNVCEAIAYTCRKYLNIPSEVVDSLDFELDTPLEIDSSSLVIAISHSGNTLATSLAVEKAKSLGAYTVGIAAVPGSRLPDIAHYGLIDPNPYEGRPKGKIRSYHSSVMLGDLVALAAASPELMDGYVDEAKKVVALIRENLEAWKKEARELASQWAAVASRYMLAGFGVQKPNADEIGLKIIEVIGESATSYSLEELTHGPGASFRKDMGVILFQTDPRTLKRCLEIARGIVVSDASLVVITDQPSVGWPEKASIMALPAHPRPELFGLFPAAAAAQCLMYSLAIAKGMNPDVNCVDRYPELAEVSAIFFPPGTH
jgi:glucosamine 6-phosphate synthetase-like amidotransferase/phosphosugar isomerase protein